MPAGRQRCRRRISRARCSSRTHNKEPAMQAGFIGLGTMGASMAANLQKGLKARGDTLVVHDIRREPAAQHLRDGATWAESPQAVAEQCEVIFTSLPGPPEFEAVAAG